MSSSPKMTTIITVTVIWALLASSVISSPIAYDYDSKWLLG